MTRTKYVTELEKLPAGLREMAKQVDRMLAQAMETLAQRNSELTEIIFREDDDVDALNVHIESDCLTLIALYQPVGRDLRLISSAYNIVTDLERIGDHGVDIAKIARKLGHVSPFQAPQELFVMSATVRSMLRTLTVAFETTDPQILAEMKRWNEDVEYGRERFESKIYAAMESRSVDTVRASYLLFVAHHLEEISGHMVRIAERLQYYATGKLVHTQLSRAA